MYSDEPMGLERKCHRSPCVEVNGSISVFDMNPDVSFGPTCPKTTGSARAGLTNVLP